MAALLVLALDAGGARAALPELRALSLLAAEGAVPAPVAVPAQRGSSNVPPPCLADLCQQQVSVPGYEPRYSLRGARTRLTLQALDALHVEPVATVAWWIAASGVRLDYTPKALDSALHGGVGVSRFVVFVNWRMDAFGSPVRPLRGRHDML